MERRSTNQIGHAHFQGDVVSNVGSSHGVILRGGSTGGLIEPAGDDTSISLTVQARNLGILYLGSSGAPVQVAGSTAPWQGFIRFTDTAVATPNFATTNAMVMETTHAITGVAAQTIGGAQGYFVLANPHNLSTDCALLHAYVASTADEVHCRFAKVSTVTVAATTATIGFLIVRM